MSDPGADIAAQIFPILADEALLEDLSRAMDDVLQLRDLGLVDGIAAVGIVLGYKLTLAFSDNEDDCEMAMQWLRMCVRAGRKAAQIRNYR